MGGQLVHDSQIGELPDSSEIIYAIKNVRGEVVVFFPLERELAESLLEERKGFSLPEGCVIFFAHQIHHPRTQRIATETGALTVRCRAERAPTCKAERCVRTGPRVGVFHRLKGDRWSNANPLAVAQDDDATSQGG